MKILSATYDQFERKLFLQYRDDDGLEHIEHFEDRNGNWEFEADEYEHFITTKKGSLAGLTPDDLNFHFAKCVHEISAYYMNKMPKPFSDSTQIYFRNGKYELENDFATFTFFDRNGDRKLDQVLICEGASCMVEIANVSMLHASSRSILQSAFQMILAKISSRGE